MKPELLYWIALAVLVLPSVAVNRVAIIVAAVWGFGNVVYRVGPYDDVALMTARIIAVGAALALAMPCDATLKSRARFTTALLFIPAAFLAGVAAAFANESPLTMAEYRFQTGLYWTTWAVIMFQAISVPFGNDWSFVIKTGKRIDDWMMRAIVRHFGDAI